MTNFEIKSSDNNARVAILNTSHGSIETPVFMPVATQASVKSLSSEDLHNIGAQIILGNSYHLYLRPGTELLQQAGGLHAFMGWNTIASFGSYVSAFSSLFFFYIVYVTLTSGTRIKNKNIWFSTC